MERRSFLIYLFLIEVLLYSGGYWKVSSSCLDSERKALTTFRKALKDPWNRLSSWDDASDCCKWRGITCHSITGYVLELDLHSDTDSLVGTVPVFSLSGGIDPALVELKHLQFLDLSFNDFNNVPIPNFLGSMKELRYLDLSLAGFIGRIPHQLGNLSKLISLQLSNHYLSADNLWWLTSLPSLKYLGMSFVDLSMASDHWVRVMNNSPSLVELYLSACDLSYIPPTLASVNFTSLRVLSLRGNYLNSRIPNWLANISSLVSLDLSYNNFHSEVPYQFTQLPNLEELWLGSPDDNPRVDWSEILEGIWPKLKLLDLDFIQLHGGIPVSIGNMTSLVNLRLSFNENTTGSIPRALAKLINLESLDLLGYYMHAPIPDWLYELKNLKELFLFDCMLTGPIPAALLGGLSSLEELDLSSNQLNGTIPTTLGQLSNLWSLDLSYNSLTGNVSETHFENLKNLKHVLLSSNSLVFDLHPDWVPPFQLQAIRLRSSLLGPRFPPWLRTQKNIEWLDLSNATISGIIPTWFWDLTPRLFQLYLSNNEISGQLPSLLKMQSQVDIDLSSNHFSGPIPCILNGARSLDLSNNQFSGPIPPNFTSTMPYLEFFMAKDNQIGGIIPPFIGGLNSLSILDLSRNNISGVIPFTLGNCVALEVLELSQNRLSGGIPWSLGKLGQLQVMHMSSNNLSGKIPSSLKKCARLETLDLGCNNLSGHLPTWIGESFPGLRNLNLRSNMLTGNIPPPLLNLTFLQILDVAQNYLSGTIPQNIENLIAMKNKEKTMVSLYYGHTISMDYEENLVLTVKRQTREYTRTVSLVTYLDLSSNNLSGEIPQGLTSLLGLRVLNLSRNHLIGKIPGKIGKLALLESLDFSQNQLSGTIPHSMSDLTFLSCLNLSYNNLFGRIPSGNQLQTLEDPSSYIGNSGLYGPPLTNKCVCDETSHGPMVGGDDVEEEEEEYDMGWFYSAMAPGFAVGFCIFCGALVFKESWRNAYYRFFDEMKERLFFFYN